MAAAPAEDRWVSHLLGARRAQLVAEERERARRPVPVPSRYAPVWPAVGERLAVIARQLDDAGIPAASSATASGARSRFATSAGVVELVFSAEWAGADSDVKIGYERLVADIASPRGPGRESASIEPLAAPDWCVAKAHECLDVHRRLLMPHVTNEAASGAQSGGEDGA